MSWTLKYPPNGIWDFYRLRHWLAGHIGQGRVRVIYINISANKYVDLRQTFHLVKSSTSLLSHGHFNKSRTRIPQHVAVIIIDVCCVSNCKLLWIQKSVTEDENSNKVSINLNRGGFEVRLEPAIRLTKIYNNYFEFVWIVYGIFKRFLIG